MPQISAREIALLVLRAVEEEGAYANLSLNRALERYRPNKLDRAFATELTYGTLRTRNTLDWVLEQFLKKPLRSQTVIMRSILRLGVYQLLYLDRVPPSAACNEGAEMARKYAHTGAVKFVNGVLRSVARQVKEIRFPDFAVNTVNHIALRYSHPEWLVEEWLKLFGPEETIALCQANNEAALTTVRTNTLCLSREVLAERLRSEGLKVYETAYAPEGLRLEGFYSINSLNAFHAGLFQVQDESSMLASRALMPGSGTKVLDVCAAPGGKTTHLAELMGDRGEILAVDVHPHKMTLIEDNCRRLGISIVRTLVGDAAVLPENLREWADFILLDAPCTGLGVLRRRPDARWRKTPEQITSIVRLQSSILAAAAEYLKPGGVLVYSTCTITYAENLGQVNDFLVKHPEFILEDLRPYLPADLDLAGQSTLRYGYIQTLPHRQGMDGFFISRMRKKG